MAGQVFQSGIEATADHGLRDMVPALFDTLRHPCHRLIRSGEPEKNQFHTIPGCTPAGDVTQVGASRQRPVQHSVRCKPCPFST